MKLPNGLRLDYNKKKNNAIIKTLTYILVQICYLFICLEILYLLYKQSLLLNVQIFFFKIGIARNKFNSLLNEWIST